MSASTSSLVRINDTDANFRAWVAAVLTAIAAGGLVQTADSGQINPITVTRPLAGNTVQGYAIFRSDDATGGLNNFYFKIEFGSGTAANTPAIWITIGWGSDGAGTLTGNLSTRSQIQPSTSSATPIDCNFSSGTGHLVLGLWVGSGGTGPTLVLSIERTRSPSGTIEDQVFVYGGGNTSVNTNQVVPRTGTVPTQDTTSGAGWRALSVTAATYGGDKGVGTLAPQKGGWLMEAMNLFIGNSTDFATSQTQYTFTIYGASHTYISVSTANTIGVGGSNRLLIRYD